jgi:hypothetical protein
MQDMKLQETKKMRVAVLANLKKNAPTWEGMLPDQWDDLDSEKDDSFLDRRFELRRT